MAVKSIDENNLDSAKPIAPHGMPRFTQLRFVVLSCRIPDDRIDSRRYPLFMARAVLKELIESLQSTQGVKPC